MNTDIGSFSNPGMVLSKSHYESYYNKIYDMMEIVRNSDYSKMMLNSSMDIFKIDLEDAFGKNDRTVKYSP